MVGRYAVVADGIVKNIAVAEPEFAAEQGWVEVTDEVSVGWMHDSSMGFYPTPPILPSPEELSALRAEAYRAEADPLFFKAQRGEATMDEWLAKVAEIKARYPKEV